MATRDWTEIKHKRFFYLLREARSLKRIGLPKFERWIFFNGFISGFDDGQSYGFETGIFHLNPQVKNLQEALQCAHKLDAGNTEKALSADGEPIVAGNAIPDSR